MTALARWFDGSGYSANGTKVVDPLLGFDAKLFNSNCISLNGTDAYVDASPTAMPGASDYLTNVWTMSCWIKGNTPAANTFVMAYGNSANNTPLIGFGPGPNGQTLRTLTRATNNQATDFDSTLIAFDGSWHFVEWTLDWQSNELKLSVDGTTQSTTPNGNWNDFQVNQLAIGCLNRVATGNFFSGEVANAVVTMGASTLADLPLAEGAGTVCYDLAAGACSIVGGTTRTKQDLYHHNQIYGCNLPATAYVPGRRDGSADALGNALTRAASPTASHFNNCETWIDFSDGGTNPRVPPDTAQAAAEPFVPVPGAIELPTAYAFGDPLPQGSPYTFTKTEVTNQESDFVIDDGAAPEVPVIKANTIWNETSASQVTIDLPDGRSVLPSATGQRRSDTLPIGVRNKTGGLLEVTLNATGTDQILVGGQKVSSANFFLTDDSTALLVWLEKELAWIEYAPRYSHVELFYLATPVLDLPDTSTQLTLTNDVDSQFFDAVAGIGTQVLTSKFSGVLSVVWTGLWEGEFPGNNQDAEIRIILEPAVGTPPIVLADIIGSTNSSRTGIFPMSQSSSGLIQIAKGDALRVVANSNALQTGITNLQQLALLFSTANI